MSVTFVGSGPRLRSGSSHFGSRRCFPAFDPLVTGTIAGHGKVVFPALWAPGCCCCPVPWSESVQDSLRGTSPNRRSSRERRRGGGAVRQRVQVRAGGVEAGDETQSRNTRTRTQNARVHAISRPALPLPPDLHLKSTSLPERRHTHTPMLTHVHTQAHTAASPMHMVQMAGACRSACVWGGRSRARRDAEKSGGRR